VTRAAPRAASLNAAVLRRMMGATLLPTRNASLTAHWMRAKTRRPLARSGPSPQTLHAWKSEARPVASSREPLLAEFPHEPQRARLKLVRSRRFAP